MPLDAARDTAPTLRSPALALADIFVRPSVYFPPEQHLCAEELALLPSSGALREKVLAALLGLHDLKFGADFAALLESSDTGESQDTRLKLALGLVLAPAERLQRLLNYLTAALFQQRLRLAVLKADRAALIALLGPQAFEAGLRHAPAFTPDLASLAPNGLAPESWRDEAALHLVDLVSEIDQGLGELLARRLRLALPVSEAKAERSERAEAALWRLIEAEL